MILVVFYRVVNMQKTKRIGENLVELRSKYRDLITERFLGWQTIKTFDTVDIEAKKLFKYKKAYIKIQ